MKKYITLCALALTATFPVQAQYLFTRQEHNQLNTQIQRTLANQTKVEATLTVEIPVNKQYLTNPDDTYIHFSNSAEYRTRRNIPTYKSTVGCKAYALDDHWLIAGAVCLWNGRHQVNINGKKYQTGLIEEDSSQTYLKVNDTQIPMKGNLFVQPRFTMLPHFLLVRIPQDSPLAATVQQMPKVNILALAHTNPLQLQKGLFYVNTSRFGWDTARTRIPEAYDATTNTITIRELFDDLASLSNDPLLYAFQNKIYWIGINNGVMVAKPNAGWDGQSSKEFVTFSNIDLDFIRRIIGEQDPAAWPRIAPHLYRDRIQ